MKTETEVQNENINELIRLAKENPTLRIVPMVDNDVCNDEYSSYLGQWGKPCLDERYDKDEIIYFRSNDGDERLMYDLMDESEEDINEEKAWEIVDSYEWEKVILVNINTL